MKSAMVGAALMVALSSTAFAQGGGGNHWPKGSPEQSEVQPLTRAQVRAELAQAQKDGTLVADNRPDYPAAHFKTTSTKTRADVKAELVKAQQDGSQSRLPLGGD